MIDHGSWLDHEPHLVLHREIEGRGSHGSQIYHNKGKSRIEPRWRYFLKRRYDIEPNCKL